MKTYQHVDDAYRDLVKFVLDPNNHQLKENRTGTDTLSVFGYSYRLKLFNEVEPAQMEGEADYNFAPWPLLTTKFVNPKAVIDENLWFLTGMPHIKQLQEKGYKFWDAWADPETSVLQTSYGRYWRQFPMAIDKEWYEGEAFETNAEYIKQSAEGNQIGFDQIRWLIDQLKKNPNSRRLVVTAWHPQNAVESKLPPCHLLFVVNVANGILNLHLTQRSGDIGLGIPFNIAGYALLARLLAREAGLKVGEFSHTIVDAHIYVNHIEGLKKQLEQPIHAIPLLKINKKPMLELTSDDFDLLGYVSGPRIPLPIAV